MTAVRENCLRVFERIQRAAERSGRQPDSIRLIAVTKTVEPEHILEAVESGIHDVGENRLQEGLAKREALGSIPLTWHFIGHLQTNKARKAVESFDWVQSVDRADLAEKLNQCALRPVEVLIEVKLHEEPKKSGIEEQQLDSLVEQFHRYERLHLRGLMAIPPPSGNPEEVRPYFRKLRELAARFDLAELSMGMSGDFEVAIEEGATMVRIGTALFGERKMGT